MLVWILVIVALIALVYIALHEFRFGVVSMINGGVKSGKTCLVVSQAIKFHKRALFRAHFRTFINKFRKHPKTVEIPYLYSNIPLKYKYYKPLTTDHIKRQIRFEYGSVVVLSEISLIANSMSYRDEILNEQIELFIKLFGHETCGGRMFIDTQALGDNHYAVKRSIDKTVWIERLINLPFLPFLIFRVRSLMVCDENTINLNTGSGDNECKTILVWKGVFRKYDRYCYSVFTDSLEKSADKPKAAKCLKVSKVPSFRKFKTLGVFTDEK